MGAKKVNRFLAEFGAALVILMALVGIPIKGQVVPIENWRPATGSTILSTSTISPGACSYVIKDAAPNATLLDHVSVIFSDNPLSSLPIFTFTTPNKVNFKICNNSNTNIKSIPLRVNWAVVTCSFIKENTRLFDIDPKDFTWMPRKDGYCYMADIPQKSGYSTGNQTAPIPHTTLEYVEPSTPPAGERYCWKDAVTFLTTCKDNTGYTVIADPIHDNLDSKLNLIIALLNELIKEQQVNKVIVKRADSITQVPNYRVR